MRPNWLDIPAQTEKRLKETKMNNSIFMTGAALLSLLAGQQAFAVPNFQDLALNKSFISSDSNVSGWNSGLTDGSWQAEREKTFATGNSCVFPKSVTVDLATPTRIGYVVTGVPPYGSTRTVDVSLSANGSRFTQIGEYVFSQKKAENHLFEFAPVRARYVRLTYTDHYPDAAGFDPTYAFTSEIAVYAPGAAPALPPPAATPPGLEPTDLPAPKRIGDGSINPSFLESHESFLKRGKEGPIGVLFLGDSITHRWLGVPQIWQQYYGKYDPADFGIEGDQTQHVLWRIANGELAGIQPKVVVLMIGTNNIGYPSDEIVKGDTKIVSEIHRNLPGTKVLLLGIFPRGADANDPVRAKIKGINAELAKLDNGGSTRYLDIGDKFLAPDGSLTKEMFPDALHPAPSGYQIWADAMQPLLASMMKP